MTMVNALVKWGKEKYEVEVNVCEPVDSLKAVLFSLTNVPVSKQKLLMKGKQLKDQAQLEDMKPGAKIMMMGTADVLAHAPDNLKFVEDLPEEELANALSLSPPGLKNLGNTCYLNSTLQCLKGITPLREALVKYSGDPTVYGDEEKDNGVNTVTRLGKLMEEMGTGHDAIIPYGFLSAFKMQFPMFAETGPQGVPMQHDAEESMSQLMRLVFGHLKVGPSLPTGSRGLFEGTMRSSITSAEVPDYPVEVKTQPFSILNCHISSKTNYLVDGIREGLVENIEKHVDSLGRNSVFEKNSSISKLPPFLTINFVRFFWKVDIQKKTKIMRKVDFPERLDVSEFCSEDLASQIRSYRDAVDEAADAARDMADQMMIDGIETMETNSNVEDPTDCMLSGMYEICGVITHKGRAADSGHYIGWVLNDEGKWYKFDDDVVTEVTIKEIKGLSGGGDWHSAYICFYRNSPETGPHVESNTRVFNRVINLLHAGWREYAATSPYSIPAEL